MTDWRRIVRQRLAEAGHDPAAADAVVEELAGHLEELAGDARLQPEQGERAALRAASQETDWDELGRAVQRLRQEDDMNDRVRRVWLPGVVVTAVAYGLWTTLLAMGMQPTVVWLRPASFTFFFVPWLLLLPVLGAAAAFWSNRNGGARRDMLAACCIAPLALAIFLSMAFVIALFGDAHVAASVKLRQMGMLVLTVVVVPALALLVGAVPFLRQRAKA